MADLIFKLGEEEKNQHFHSILPEKLEVLWRYAPYFKQTDSGVRLRSAILRDRVFPSRVRHRVRVLKPFNISTTKRKGKGECPFNAANTIEAMAAA